MTEPNIIHCLLCRATFPRSRQGADEYFNHLQRCFNRQPDSSNHPSGHTPKGAA